MKMCFTVRTCILLTMGMVALAKLHARIVFGYIATIGRAPKRTLSREVGFSDKQALFSCKLFLLSGP